MYVVYSKTNCPACVQAKKLLKDQGMEFTEVNIEKDAVAKEFVLQEGHKSVPQIYKDNSLIGGLRDLHQHVADNLKAQDDQA